MFKFGKSDEKARMRAMACKAGWFNNKAAAFDYYYFHEGMTSDEAMAEADKVATARGIPATAPPPVSFVDKAKNFMSQASELSKEHPQISDFVVGLISGAVTSLGGAFAGAKIEQNAEKPPEYDYNSLETKDIE